MRRQRFSRAIRLTRGADMERVRREGARVRGGKLDVRVLIEQSSDSRIGIIVPRYGQTAVARNRVKRRLREIVRQELVPQLIGVSVLFRARPEAYGASSENLRRDVRGVCARIVKLTGETRDKAP